MPRKITSPVLGALKFHRSDGSYSVAMDHKGAEISLHFLCQTDDAIQRFVPIAERVWKGRVRYFKAFREYAVSNLLDQLNGFLDCGEEDPPQVTASQLRGMLKTPFSITFILSGNEYEDEMFFISGGDDPRLLDHCLAVYFDSQGNITDGEAVSLF
ncbi:hypothetical protein Poly51_63460 [Rubripirellula tenax]|uniref:DUF2262 domain-containing protein n=1 Tax=Rubripirellula tenax TaxID=2528015 RepID=A0A5C6E4X6_9BACT|nr:DUF2262 domain-containing protein [Rubripirellula tenax]TWU43554.1 hypothetical protein Poly51_63460 [Rubripirellula tenax]